MNLDVQRLIIHTDKCHNRTIHLTPLSEQSVRLILNVHSLMGLKVLYNLILICIIIMNILIVSQSRFYTTFTKGDTITSGD